MSDTITYRRIRNYKYQLRFDTTINTQAVGFSGEHPYVALLPHGTMLFARGYAWDGPSGPTIDTKDFMRGSLVHDGLYQLMRERLLPQSFRVVADQELRRFCIEDGMPRWRAAYVYWGVQLFGAAAALPAMPTQWEVAP